MAFIDLFCFLCYQNLEQENLRQCCLRLAGLCFVTGEVWWILHHTGYFPDCDQCDLVNQLNVYNFRLHSSPGELSPSHLLRKSPSPASTVNCSKVSISLLVKGSCQIAQSLCLNQITLTCVFVRECVKYCQLPGSSSRISSLIYGGISSSPKGLFLRLRRL